MRINNVLHGIVDNSLTSDCAVLSEGLLRGYAEPVLKFRHSYFGQRCLVDAMSLHEAGRRRDGQIRHGVSQGLSRV